MALMTPLLHAKGVYELRDPWTIAPGIIYECIAIRSFQDLDKLGEDVYDKYYVGNNLTPVEYEQDKLLGANIITLASPSHPTIYVPDTYIVKFPDLNNVKYQLLVLSVDLGPMPDYTDVEYLKTSIANLVSDAIGVSPDIHLHSAPHTGVVTEAEHQALEAVRNAHVELRTTDYAEVLRLRASNTKLIEQHEALVDIVKSHGLIPE